MTNIRLATLSDLEKIKELNHKLFIKEHRDFDNTLDCDWSFTDRATDYFSGRIEGKNGCAFVAEVEGEVVGYLVGGLGRNPTRQLNGSLGELENIFVEEDFRDQGLGKKLVEAFDRWCQDNQVTRVKVVVSAGNTKGLSFYKREGFFDWEVVLEKEIK